MYFKTEFKIMKNKLTFDSLTMKSKYFKIMYYIENKVVILHEKVIFSERNYVTLYVEL